MPTEANEPAAYLLWTRGDCSAPSRPDDIPAPPLPEETENGPTATRYYSLNGLRVAKATNGEFTWIHSDHLHSATILTDESGAEIRRLAYRAFGEELENTGTGTAPKYSYTGKELDSSGLYYYGARYYDPELSRVITPDTVYDVGPQGLNRYSYALNNPVRYNDPNGHTAIALDVTNLIERNQAIREYVDVLPNFLLDLFLPVTSEDVASGMADQIFGCVGMISGPGKKAAEGVIDSGKQVAKDMLEESGDEILQYSRKVTKTLDELENIPSYEALEHLVKNVLDFSTKEHGAVFWAGKNMNVAQLFAKLTGKTTLEQTGGGRYLKSLKLFENWKAEQAIKIWDMASERFAAQAKGHAYVFRALAKPMNKHGQVRTWFRLEHRVLARGQRAGTVRQIRHIKIPFLDTNRLQ